MPNSLMALGFEWVEDSRQNNPHADRQLCEYINYPILGLPLLPDREIFFDLEVPYTKFALVKKVIEKVEVFAV